VTWILTGIGIWMSLPLGVLFLLAYVHLYLRWRYMPMIVRIFEEKPLFVVPRGDPVPDAEDVHFPTENGRILHGCYLRTRARRRRGVILFGLEFGSNCWSCGPYCEHLVNAGYDVFAFEPRGQGDSDSEPGYEPLQWVTDHEVSDVYAALTYLRSRSDADPRGVGFFGISKGGTAGLLAAVNDPYIRCCVTDGAFATYTTMVPYMRKWFRIYNDRYLLQGLIPFWYYGAIGCVGLNRIAKARRCSFPHLEWVISRISPRPLLMIHGRADTYIKWEMAKAVFDRAGERKEFWLVDGAKHNQALQVAREEYRRRVLDFFNAYLAEQPHSARGRERQSVNV